MSTATQIRTTDHAVTDVVYQEDIVRSPMLRKLLAVGRIVIGWTFMWAFLDKVFGLGFATTTGVHKTMVAGNNGGYFWGGAASTFFWTDPVEEMTVLFLTQLIPSSTWPVRRQLRSLVYSSVI